MQESALLRKNPHMKMFACKFSKGNYEFKTCPYANLFNLSNNEIPLQTCLICAIKELTESLKEKKRVRPVTNY